MLKIGSRSVKSHFLFDYLLEPRLCWFDEELILKYLFDWTWTCARTKNTHQALEFFCTGSCMNQRIGSWFDETIGGLNTKLETWREALERKGSR